MVEYVFKVGEEVINEAVKVEKIVTEVGVIQDKMTQCYSFPSKNDRGIRRGDHSNYSCP